MNTLLRRLQKPFLFAFLALASLTLLPQKAQAQWTVFDPTTYASITQIWSEDISTNAKLAMELQQGASLLTQTMQIYSLARQEASYLEKGQLLRAVGFAAAHASIPGHPDWDRSMTMVAGTASAGLTWQSMTNPGLSLRNRIMMTDSFATSALNSLGNCNAAAMNNGSAIGSMEGLAYSMGSGNNTGASQRAIGNMTAEQQLRYHQCEENLAEQKLKIDLLRAQEMRDRDQATINSNQSIAQYNSAGGGEWDVTPLQDLQRKGMH